jgi:hypothetical protein
MSNEPIEIKNVEDYLKHFGGPFSKEEQEGMIKRFAKAYHEDKNDQLQVVRIEEPKDK